MNEERAIEKEWIEVAERRLAEIEAGTVKPVPAEEAHERVRRSCGLRVESLRC